MIWRFICTLALSSPGLRSWNTVWNSGAGITNQSRTVYDAANGYRYVTNIAPDNSYSVAITRYGTNVSVTAFDSLNNQLSSINYSYDAHGRPCKFTDARTGTTTNFFNNADQVTGTATPAPSATEASQVTTNYFDVMGRVWKTVLSDGGVVTNDFSLMSQPRTVSGARTYASGNGYDAQGRFKSLTNWSAFPSTGARSTTWNYDPYRGWLTGKSYPDGTGPSYTYTVAGRLNTRLWARGTNATYSYNFAGDLGTTFYSDSTAGVTNKFDRLGRTTSVTNGTSVCNYTFNDLGLMLTETNAAGILSGLSVTNGYDLLLRRTNLSLLSPISQLLSAASYAYDSASRLKTVSSGTNSATYSYLANSPLVSQVFYTNGNTLRMTRSNQFDNLNRLTNLVWNAGGSNVASFAYQYNSANQRTRATLADGSYWLYQYDTLGQVTSSKKYWSDGTPVAGQQTTFDFDDIGNRKSAASGGDSGGANLRSAYYTNNTLNQITGRTVPGYVGVLGSATNIATVTVNNQATYRRNDYFRAELTATNASSSLWFGVTNLAVLNNGTNADIIASTTGFVYVAQSPETFGYDLDGNLTNSGRWTITWDAENRATSFTRISTAPSASKAKVDCTYDYRWRRMQKIVSTWNGSAYVAQSTNKFVYDGWNLIAILDATNGLVQSFTWGSDASGSLQGAGGVGGLISMTVHQGTNAGTYFYCFDGNHNVTALVNATNGAIAAQYEFDAFGNPLRATGALAFVNPFTFSTKFCDWETGFLYYGYRYYDPSAGRWLSRDPIGEAGGANIYGFLQNDPATKIDILGLLIGNYNFPMPIPFATKKPDPRTTVTFVAKSFIQGIPEVGTIGDRNGNRWYILLTPPGLWLYEHIGLSGWFSDSRMGAFASFSRNLDAFDEDPQTPAKDGKYRLYTRLTIRAECCKNELIYSIETDSAGGKELGPIYGTIHMAQTTQQISKSSTRINWRGWGRPNNLLEPGMQLVGKRTSVNIWHEVNVVVSCKDGKPIFDFEGEKHSAFPSLRIWKDDQRIVYQPQGRFSNLWQPNSSNPNFVAP